MSSIVYFLLWAGLIFLMMRFGCGAHVMGHGGHRHRHRHPEDAGHSGGEWTAPLKDTDPVCGMTVETAKSKSSLHLGHVFYFCSQNCREQFEAAPQAYIKDSAGSPAAMEAYHGTH